MLRTAQEGSAGGEDQFVREGDIAGDYLECLLDGLGYDGDIRVLGESRVLGKIHSCPGRASELVAPVQTLMIANV